MSLLFDRYSEAMKPAPKPEEKPTPPPDEKPVDLNTFSEHGLGDKPSKKKEPNHSAESEVKRLNKRLEKIDAPFYAVCKDDGKMGFRKVKPSCDPDHPNVTYSREKTVDAFLKENEKEAKKEEKKEEKPAEKPHKKEQDKPDEKKSFFDELKAKHPDEVKGYGITKASRYKDSENIHVTSFGYIENDFNVRILRLAKKYYSPDNMTGVIQFEIDGKTVKHRPKPTEKPQPDNRDAQSAKFMEMMEAKFNKILESKG